MSRGKRKRGRSREVSTTERASMPRPAILRADPTVDPRALAMNCVAANVMLIECPTFEAEVRDGDVYAKAIETPTPAVCKSCGRFPGAVEWAGCPKMRSIESVLGAMIPAEELHADPPIEGTAQIVDAQGNPLHVEAVEVPSGAR